MTLPNYESVTAHDNTSIRTARFDPIDKPCGVIQIIHGFGEGIFHYREVADFFTQNGYACIIHDQRGFGEMPDKSPKQRTKARGVVPSYECLLRDVETIREKIDEWYPDVPVILLGHSMGGNLAMNLLLKSKGRQYKKAIFEAPWLRLYKPLPNSLAILARLLGKISGKLRVASKLDAADIAPNQAETKSLKTDGVYHDRVSLRLYTGVSDAGEYAIKHAADIQIPALLLSAGQDKIVCSEAIREFAKNAGENVKLIEYPKGYHCLHADPINAQSLDDMLEFCKAGSV